MFLVGAWGTQVWEHTARCPRRFLVICFMLMFVFILMVPSTYIKWYI